MNTDFLPLSTTPRLPCWTPHHVEFSGGVFRLPCPLVRVPASQCAARHCVRGGARYPSGDIADLSGKRGAYRRGQFLTA